MCSLRLLIREAYNNIMQNVLFAASEADTLKKGVVTLKIAMEVAAL